MQKTILLAVAEFGDRLRIVQEREDGRGGIVDAPMAIECEVDLSLTEGGGKGIAVIDREYLQAVADSVGRLPNVPIYWSHDEALRRSKKGEMPTHAIGRVLKAWVDGNELMGRLDLGPQAWKSVVQERGFFGGSVEVDYDVLHPTAKSDGPTLTGFIFSNYGALPVRFQSGARDRGLPTEEPSMPDDTKKLETLQADKAALETKVTELEAKAAKVTALETENADLKTKLATSNATQAEKDGKIAALEVRVGAVETANKSLESEHRKAEVVSICEKAALEGVLPAQLVLSDGKPYTDDPMKFLAENGGSIETLRAKSKHWPRQSFGRRLGPADVPPSTGGGSAQEKLAEAAKKLSAEKKITFLEALDHLKETNDPAHALAMSEREEERQRASALQRGEA